MQLGLTVVVVVVVTVALVGRNETADLYEMVAVEKRSYLAAARVRANRHGDRVSHGVHGVRGFAE